MIELAPAQRKIEPVLNRLVAVYVESTKAWKELVEEKPALALPMGESDRASFLHAHLRHEARQRFPEDDPIARPTEALDFFALLWVDGSILLRLKYLRDGLPSNYRTEQQRELARQQFSRDAMLALTGDPSLDPPTLLTCGYRLENGLDLASVEIRCDCKHHLPWRYEIYGGEVEEEPQIIYGLTDHAKPAKIKSTKSPERERHLHVVTDGDE